MKLKLRESSQNRIVRKSKLTEGKMKDSTPKDQYYDGMNNKLPSGENSKIYKGKYADVVVLSDNGEEVVVYLSGYDKDNYPMSYETYFSNESEAIEKAEELCKYVDDDIYNLDKVCIRLGLKNI